MEIALAPDIPTYSGGLGILAGDTLRAAADAELPMVAVSLLYRKGYFRQSIDAFGHQSETPVTWNPSKHLQKTNVRVTILIKGSPVVLRIWRYSVLGVRNHAVPVFLLDSDLEENDEWSRSITDSLYGDGPSYRLAQEMVLGMGGVAALRALGYRRPMGYHMNEGHAALLSVALIEELAAARGDDIASEDDLAAVKSRCVFTTHTPVPAGHDVFPRDLASAFLGAERPAWGALKEAFVEGDLNMTALALHCSRYVNGVAMRHAQVSRSMFPDYAINSITNGVHAGTWMSPPFQRLFDSQIPEWRLDNQYLRYALDVPTEDIEEAHREAKADLVTLISRRGGPTFSDSACTIVFARRATAYKRAELLFTDVDRLSRIAKERGPLQILFSGKAAPMDESGHRLIAHVYEMAARLQGDIKVAYLADYDMEMARTLCAGADVWLNTPQKPFEASGTSGMKAALNGVPSLSVLDGWWLEGHVEWFTGWSIGDREPTSHSSDDAESLYRQLEHSVLPMFYDRPDDFAAMRRSTIALNGSFFTAQRMVDQYVKNAYTITDAS